MAYDIIEGLMQRKQSVLLETLAAAVQNHDRKYNKQHYVFNPSYGRKPCYSYKFIEQKLVFIHHNPVAKHWRLIDDLQHYFGL